MLELLRSKKWTLEKAYSSNAIENTYRVSLDESSGRDFYTVKLWKVSADRQDSAVKKITGKLAKYREKRHADHCARLYEYGTRKAVDGRLLIWVRTDDLIPIEDYLDRDVTVSDALDLGRDLCGVVSQTVARGASDIYIHPENIFMSEDGSGYVADFGIREDILALSGYSAEEMKDGFAMPDLTGGLAEDAASGGLTGVMALSDDYEKGQVCSIATLLNQLLDNDPGPKMRVVIDRACAADPASRCSVKELRAMLDEIVRSDFPNKELAIAGAGEGEDPAAGAGYAGAGVGAAGVGAGVALGAAGIAADAIGAGAAASGAGSGVRSGGPVLDVDGSVDTLGLDVWEPDIDLDMELDSLLKEDELNTDLGESDWASDDADENDDEWYLWDENEGKEAAAEAAAAVPAASAAAAAVAAGSGETGDEIAVEEAASADDEEYIDENEDEDEEAAAVSAGAASARTGAPRRKSGKPKFDILILAIIFLLLAAVAVYLLFFREGCGGASRPVETEPSTQVTTAPTTEAASSETTTTAPTTVERNPEDVSYFAGDHDGDYLTARERAILAGEVFIGGDDGVDWGVDNGWDDDIWGDNSETPTYNQDQEVPTQAPTETTAEEPSSEEPPTEEPPTQEPPTEEQPTQEPPTQEPPTQEPPTEEQPSEEPAP